MIVLATTQSDLDDIDSKIKDTENKIKEAKIYQEIMGSDHCPVELDIEI